MSFEPNSLLRYQNHNPTAKERVGFLLGPEKEIVEVDNICSDPVNGFCVKGSDLLKYVDTATGSWHTHPGSSSNFTIEDQKSFLSYPHLSHYIIGIDGVSCYVIKNGKVLVATESLSPRDVEVDPRRPD